MNRMTTLALPLSCLLAVAGCASTAGSTPADIDLANAQVAVRTEKNGDTIEEYRVAGNLRMVKVTPAHDPNDFDMGRRHDLPMVNVMTETAEMNENAGPYQGMSREEQC